MVYLPLSNNPISSICVLNANRLNRMYKLTHARCHDNVLMLQLWVRKTNIGQQGHYKHRSFFPTPWPIPSPKWKSFRKLWSNVDVAIIFNLCALLGDNENIPSEEQQQQRRTAKKRGKITTQHLSFAFAFCAAAATAFPSTFRACHKTFNIDLIIIIII